MHAFQETNVSSSGYVNPKSFAPLPPPGGWTAAAPKGVGDKDVRSHNSENVRSSGTMKPHARPAKSGLDWDVEGVAGLSHKVNTSAASDQVRVSRTGSPARYSSARTTGRHQRAAMDVARASAAPSDTPLYESRDHFPTAELDIPQRRSGYSRPERYPKDDLYSDPPTMMMEMQKVQQLLQNTAAAAEKATATAAFAARSASLASVTGTSETLRAHTETRTGGTGPSVQMDQASQLQELQYQLDEERRARKEEREMSGTLVKRLQSQISSQESTIIGLRRKGREKNNGSTSFGGEGVYLSQEGASALPSPPPRRPYQKLASSGAVAASGEGRQASSFPVQVGIAEARMARHVAELQRAVAGVMHQIGGGRSDADLSGAWMESVKAAVRQAESEFTEDLDTIQGVALEEVKHCRARGGMGVVEKCAVVQAVTGIRRSVDAFVATLESDLRARFGMRMPREDSALQQLIPMLTDTTRAWKGRLRSIEQEVLVEVGRCDKELGACCEYMEEALASVLARAADEVMAVVKGMQTLSVLKPDEFHRIVRALEASNEEVLGLLRMLPDAVHFAVWAASHPDIWCPGSQSGAARHVSGWVETETRAAGRGERCLAERSWGASDGDRMMVVLLRPWQGDIAQEDDGSVAQALAGRADGSVAQLRAIQRTAQLVPSKLNARLKAVGELLEEALMQTPRVEATAVNGLLAVLHLHQKHLMSWEVALADVAATAARVHSSEVDALAVYIESVAQAGARRVATASREVIDGVNKMRRQEAKFVAAPSDARLALEGDGSEGAGMLAEMLQDVTRDVGQLCAALGSHITQAVNLVPESHGEMDPEVYTELSELHCEQLQGKLRSGGDLIALALEEMEDGLADSYAGPLTGPIRRLQEGSDGCQEQLQRAMSHLNSSACKVLRVGACLQRMPPPAAPCPLATIHAPAGELWGAPSEAEVQQGKPAEGRPAGRSAEGDASIRRHEEHEEKPAPLGSPEPDFEFAFESGSASRPKSPAARSFEFSRGSGGPRASISRPTSATSPKAAHRRRGVQGSTSDQHLWEHQVGDQRQRARAGSPVWGEGPGGKTPQRGELHGSQEGRLPADAAEHKAVSKDGEDSRDLFQIILSYLKTSTSRASELFKRFDKNRDGMLNKEEMRRMIRYIYPQVSQRQLRHFMLMCDLDGDGVISFSELSATLKEAKRIHGLISTSEDLSSSTHPIATAAREVLMRLHALIHTQSNHCESLFRTFDRSRDGHLTPMELRDMLRTLMPSINPNEMKYLLAHLEVMDMNKDGRISFDEFKGVLEEFKLQMKLYR
ncbi:calcium-dependent protein kinase [Cymbomonas tetramitiformis]|uniref:Calcium-dependent protein kinase n=1 Tax=Cymbomonas tetramitiformis TaxID=36881 RepID=A0AAE0EVF8_9CHLO|nr:calcium-dependent protein kinase [Cymbomonas tetramitiformis]